MDQQPASIQFPEGTDQSNIVFKAQAQNAALKRASMSATDSMDITKGQGHSVHQRHFEPELPFHSSRQRMPPPHSEVASYERLPPPNLSRFQCKECHSLIQR